MTCTTLCYLEKNEKYLMLHRIKKEHDMNKDKWIGIGGHCEEGESPEDCIKREILEETGIIVESPDFRGIVTFVSGAEKIFTEYMMIFTSSDFIEPEELPVCDEGVLEWLPKDRLWNMDLWDGDRVFLRLLAQKSPFFSLKLVYDGDDRFTAAVLNGKDLELFDIVDDNGNPTGKTEERETAHFLGTKHRSSHMWISDGKNILFQKRAACKDSNPGCYDISSAGHIAAGDDPLSSAIREMKEELGLDIKENDLIFLGLHKGSFEKEFHGKLFKDDEVSFVYLCKCIRDNDGHISFDGKRFQKLVFQKSEVDDAKWMDPVECFNKLNDPSFPNCIYPDELQMVIRSL